MDPGFRRECGHLDRQLSAVGWKSEAHSTDFAEWQNALRFSALRVLHPLTAFPAKAGIHCSAGKVVPVRHDRRARTDRFSSCTTIDPGFRRECGC